MKVTTWGEENEKHVIECGQSERNCLLKGRFDKCRHHEGVRNEEKDVLLPCVDDEKGSSSHDMFLFSNISTTR